MSEDNTDFQAKLASIRADYARVSLPVQISEILDKFGNLAGAMGSGDHINCTLAMNAVAHKLAGSAGTFGLDQISVVSRTICQLTECARLESKPVTSENFDKISTLVDQLRLQAEQLAPQNDKRPSETGDNTGDNIK